MICFHDAFEPVYALFYGMVRNGELGVYLEWDLCMLSEGVRRNLTVVLWCNG